VVLEQRNKLIGAEVKYKRKAVNKAFKNRYPEAKVRLVTADILLKEIKDRYLILTVGMYFLRGMVGGCGF
jgi:hypothetical protein